MSMQLLATHAFLPSIMIAVDFFCFLPLPKNKASNAATKARTSNPRNPVETILMSLALQFGHFNEIFFPLGCHSHPHLAQRFNGLLVGLLMAHHLRGRQRTAAGNRTARSRNRESMSEACYGWPFDHFNPRSRFNCQNLGIFARALQGRSMKLPIAMTVVQSTTLCG